MSTPINKRWSTWLNSASLIIAGVMVYIPNLDFSSQTTAIIMMVCVTITGIAQQIKQGVIEDDSVKSD